MTNATPYDEILYPTGPQPASHPDRLATLATLMGMTPAPPTRCRVLEIACGDGGNLLPMAFQLPESRFTGFDLAQMPIAAGKERASALGLRNLYLEAKDLMSVTADYGRFDYIIAHGLYSWIPAPVQDKLLEICRTNLAPQGVAYVSYNAYPGCYIKQGVRNFLAQFIRPFDTSPDSIARARELLGFTQQVRAETGPWGPTMAKMASILGSRSHNVLAHDEMGEQYHPIYFRDFAAHAGRHGLQYLSEADFDDTIHGWLEPEELELLGRLEGDPILLREQYMDFLRFRAFRNTLLCRQEVQLDRDQATDATLRLLVSSRMRPVSEKPDLDTVSPERFQVHDHAGMTASIVGIKRALVRLASDWPRPIPATELISTDLPAGELAGLLRGLYGANLATLQTHWTPYVARPGERPTAGTLARLQLSFSPRVTSQTHWEVTIQDPVTMKLLSVLDGTRDRAAILAELRTLEPAVSPEILERALGRLADSALLVA